MGDVKKEKMVYKINKKAVLKNLDYIIFITIVYAVIVLYYEDYKVAYTINAFTLFYLIPLIVVIFLFWDYYFHTKGQKVFFSDENIVVKTAKVDKKYEKSDVEKVTLYAAPSFRRNSTFRLLPFEAFHFVEIKMNSSKGGYIYNIFIRS
ncbi:hypothetical protein [Galbibacter pacificus]|uniref:PH domain-containing protein n=1 Tax=Galbibacter pacificus TaxID=2996052 RepID=A0ABT6FNA2_9FLAO|nr:hypothetical protein [Galbibacter pacificus]MDG3581266.1 hypothetical protein [Galbibacter pacificus]MDG3584744.1 hypothetical protein [Galbibacter pacificus]